MVTHNDADGHVDVSNKMSEHRPVGHPGAPIEIHNRSELLWPRSPHPQGTNRCAEK